MPALSGAVHQKLKAQRRMTQLGNDYRPEKSARVSVLKVNLFVLLFANHSPTRRLEVLRWVRSSVPGPSFSPYRKPTNLDTGFSWLPRRTNTSFRFSFVCSRFVVTPNDVSPMSAELTTPTMAYG